MLKDLIKLIKFIKDLNKDSIIFFSESKNYANYFKKIIDCLTYEHKKKVNFITLDTNDDSFQDNDKVKKLLLSKRLLQIIFFQFVKCRFFILTMTNLNNSYLLKSKFCKEYLYIFHSMNSAHGIYEQDALKHYDTICCNGDYHLNEIKKLESLFGFKKKKLLKSGYPYFDLIEEKKKKNEIPLDKKLILIAPSWNENKQSMLELYCDSIIEKLISKNFKIILRPHPEHFKRSLDTINQLKNKYKNKIVVEENIKSLDSLFKSNLLITDWSGIAFEYLFCLNKKVVSIETPPKIMNKNYKILDIELFEEKIKTLESVLILKKHQLEKIPELVNEFLDKKIETKNDNLDKLIFNYGKSSEFISNYIIKNLTINNQINK